MRTSNIKATIDMPIPVGVPDENGFVYTRDAVREAVRAMGSIPLKLNEKVIGTVEAGYIASEDEHKSVLRLYAVIPFGGTLDHVVGFDESTHAISKYSITEVGFDGSEED